MTLTRKKTIIWIAVLTLIAAAIAIKLLFFPSLKEAYFATEARGLQRAPAGLVIIRPTHFAFLHGQGILYADSPRRTDKGYWIMGRNAPLRAVVGLAFGQNPSRVVMPAGAPAGHFDFLVTTADKQEEALQAAIRRKFGYVAQTKSRATSVLALKVKDARLPGLTLSGTDEKPKSNFMDYEIEFKHRPVAVVARLLDRNLPTPVMDETGLTDTYNFSIRWDFRTAQRMQNGEIGLADVNQMLAGLGLELEPETASLEMLVVEQVK